MTIKSLIELIEDWSPRSYGRPSLSSFYNLTMNDICGEHDFDFLEYEDDYLVIPLAETDTATFSADSTTLTLTDTSSLSTGMRVTGTGIATGTTINTIDSSTQVTTNLDTQQAGTGVTLTFTKMKYPISDIKDVSGNAVTIRQIISIKQPSGSKISDYKLINNNIVFKSELSNFIATIHAIHEPTELDYTEINDNSYTIPLPSPHNVIELGMKKRIEEDMFQDANPRLIEDYDRALMAFLANRSGSRFKDPRQLEIANYGETKDGTKVNVF